MQSLIRDAGAQSSAVPFVALGQHTTTGASPYSAVGGIDHLAIFREDLAAEANFNDNQQKNHTPINSGSSWEKLRWLSRPYPASA